MSKIKTAEIVVKSANVENIKNSVIKARASIEKITDEYKKLKGPNACGLYGNNLKNLRANELSISYQLLYLSDAYLDFEDALSRYETSQSKVISDIKVPKIVKIATKVVEPVTEPKTTPTTDPKTEPITVVPPKPDPPFDPIIPTEPITAPITAPIITDPTKRPDNPPVRPDSPGDGMQQVTLTSPEPPQQPEPQSEPQPPQEPTPPENAETFGDQPLEMEPQSEPQPPQEPTPPQKPDGVEGIPSVNNDQFDIPLVEKSEVTPVKEKSHDGVILAGGIAAVGGLAFGAVQGISALEKKKEEDKEKEEKNKDGKFIIRDEGDE